MKLETLIEKFQKRGFGDEDEYVLARYDLAKHASVALPKLIDELNRFKEFVCEADVESIEAVLAEAEEVKS